MKKRFISVVIATLFLAPFVQGVVPSKWEIRSQKDFLEGKFKGISISEEGFLSLSPKEEKIEGPPEEFYLSYILTKEGVAYLGTGHSGKIYRIDSAGQAELYYQVPEMDVYCLTLDKKGRLYAGTSPNGKIYKITAKDKGDVFFNPPEKYIWDLLFTEKGNLLAAVGESGGIYQINKEGEGELILKAAQNHILCLKLNEKGELLAGSGGKGLLYQISQSPRTKILFESPYEEIKSIALDDQGHIYAAAGGVVRREGEEEIAPIQVKSETDITLTVTPTSVETKKAVPSKEKQPSALYRVSPEGIAERIWYSDEELIYTLIWDGGGKRLIFGTGNKGRIYALNKKGEFSLLVQKDSEQVYSLIPFETKIYTISNNPSILTVLYPEQRFDGEYLSQIYDTRTVSSWGKIVWEAVVPSEDSIQFQTRSGNSKESNQTWSGWSPPYKKKEGEQVLSPKARYLQFKIIFKSQSGKTSPSLQKITLFYIQANLAPVLTRLELLPANQVFLKPPEQEEIIWGADAESRQPSDDKGKIKTYVLTKKVERKGFQTVIWEAFDQNGDNLLFALYIRREDERRWRALREKWEEKIFAFDTLSFPDGVYFIKVEASDILSNPLGMELKSEKLSSPLIIDNSLPVIRDFQAVKEKNKLTVTFAAEDTTSSIEEVNYIIRPDGWRIVFPVDGICDSKQENFKLSIPLPSKSDNLITVKVKDRRGNIGVYRHSF